MIALFMFLGFNPNVNIFIVPLKLLQFKNRWEVTNVFNFLPRVSWPKSLSDQFHINPENIRQPLVSWCFHGVLKEACTMKWVKAPWKKFRQIFIISKKVVCKVLRNLYNIFWGIIRKHREKGFGLKCLCFTGTKI